MLLRSLALATSLSLTLSAGCDRLDPCCSRAGAADPAAAAAVTIVSPQEVATLLDADGATVVVDVNPREVYDDGHVPRARWMAFDGLDRGVLPEERSTPVVVYCYNPTCGASHQAAERIAAAGWKDVRRMSAGIRGWQAAGMPIEVSR